MHHSVIDVTAQSLNRSSERLDGPTVGLANDGRVVIFVARAVKDLDESHCLTHFAVTLPVAPPGRVSMSGRSGRTHWQVDLRELRQSRYVSE